MFVAVCQTVADITFVIDSSGSINYNNPNNWDTLLNFIVLITAELKIGPNDVHVAVVRFSDTVDVQWKLDRYTDVASLRDAIRKIGYLANGTNIAGGLEMAREQVYKQQGDRPNVQDIIIFITDGVPTIRIPDTVRQANAVKKDGIYLIPVGITEEVNLPQLRQMATNANDVVTVEDFDVLDQQLKRLLDVACITTTLVPVTVPGPGRLRTTF